LGCDDLNVGGGHVGPGEARSREHPGRREAIERVGELETV
jgi:hypothetical protein